MKATGIVRRIDDLGRIVIPKEIRRTLRIRESDPLEIFTDREEALSVIEKTILLFREQGKTGERLSQTIDRLGFENVEAQLLSDDILSRKEEILAANLHTKGGAAC